MDYFQKIKKIQCIPISALQQKLGKMKNSSQSNGKLKMQKLKSDPNELQIKSPFYRRICQKVNCKCQYHKKKTEPSTKKIIKCKTSTNEIEFQSNKLEEGKAQSTQRDFNDWKGRMTTNQFKDLYLEYLKTFQKPSKHKRRTELDCYNAAFQQFLKKTYLIILQKNKSNLHLSQNDKKLLVSTFSKFSQLNKIQESKEDNFEGKDGREGTLKRFGANGSKSIKFLLDGDNSRKNSRKHQNKSYRSSFFQMIDDDSNKIFKKICMKMMMEEMRTNNEAEGLIRELADCDINLYEKILADISKEIQNGITLSNIPKKDSDILVKIVLTKIKKKVCQKQGKDANYDKKLQIINGLYDKHGFAADEEQMQLPEFWKRIKTIQSIASSRKSIKYTSSRQKIEKTSKYKDEHKKNKNQIESQDVIGRIQGSNRNNTKNNSMDNSDQQMENRRSHKESKEKALKSKMSMRDGDKENQTEKPAHQRVRKAKRNDFMRIHKNQDSDEEMPNKFPRTNKKLPLHDDYVEESKKERVKYVGDSQIFKQGRPHDKDRNSSGLNQQNQKNVVRNLMQKNKQFLKKMEDQLQSSQCENLVIKLNDGLITKKRKIRAICEIIEKKGLDNMEYYEEVLKYIEIYSEYCDLVVKSKKQKTPHDVTTAQIQSNQIDEEEFKKGLLHELLNDMKKEKDLKFICLYLPSGIQEDPLEQLILRMPQYTINDGKDRKQKPASIVQAFEENPASDRCRAFGNFVQKALNEKVYLISENEDRTRAIRKSTEQSLRRRGRTQTLSSQIQESVLRPRDPVSKFQQKMVEFRKRFLNKE